MHIAEDGEGKINANVPLWIVCSILFVVVCLTGFILSSNAFVQGLFVSGGVATTCFVVGLIWMGRAGSNSIALTRAAMKKVVEHDPDHAFLTDADGNVIAWNKHALNKFGDVKGKSIGGLFTSILVNPDAVLFRLLEDADTVGFGKEYIVTRGGHYRLILTKAGEENYLWRLEETGKATIPGLRDSDSLSIPLLTIGSRGAVLFVNEVCRAFLGYRPKSINDVFGDAPLRSGQARTVAASTGDANVTVAVIDGVTGRKEVYLIPSDSDFGPRELSTEWDAIEDLPVPLLKISSDGAVLSSNREARSLLGIATTDGKRVGDMLDGLGRPIGDWLREAIDGRGGYVSQFLRGRGDHRDTFIQVTLNTAGGSSDPHLIAVLNDVTELKTLEAQFVQSQKMQAIGQLAGGVAHDFNNLLTAISGHCDLLLLRHDQGDQNYGDLIQIHQNANRAASLVGQLLAFSRKQNLQPEVLDLRDTLSDLTHLLNRLVGEKVVLTLSHAQDLVQIKADKRQLEQVLMNLVVNARDAMPRGGEIRVVTQNVTYVEQLKRDRAVVPPGDYVLVKVSDEGHGIPSERLPKIFEPFYTTKRTGEGTGLGLSTAYGIVKQTGGFIFAESEVDRGTEFSLLFPALEAIVAPAPKPAPTLPKPLTGSDEGVVLLVEDEAPVRAFASRALRLRGYTVLEADCAETALSMLNDPNLSVDIFVTDVIMPGMDGPTWVREALSDRPDTQVVFVSGYAEDAFGDESNLVPNSVFLPKPFSLNDLTITVRAQLERGRAGIQ